MKWNPFPRNGGPGRGRRFFVFNTGCVRRGLDSIRIHDFLAGNGWVSTPRIGDADLVVVTTCGAVRDNEERSLNAIREAQRRKSEDARLVVAGCLPKIRPERIEALGPCTFIPTGELHRFDELVGARVPIASVPEANTLAQNRDIYNFVIAYRLFRKLRNSASMTELFKRLSLRPGFLRLFALLSRIDYALEGLTRLRLPQRIVPYYSISISEGCLGNCSYCCIKLATGFQRSKPIETVVEEVREGLRKGHRHIQLVAEDTGCYGIDIGTALPDLLEAVLAVEGDYRLILIDCNPRWLIRYRERLIPLFERHQDRIQELFFPIQSGSDAVLLRMRRHYGAGPLREALLEVRRRAPRVRLRTTVIVGFPGETEEDFQASLRLVDEVGFFEVTLNKYEDRPGAHSAGLDGHLPQEVVDRRGRDLYRHA